MRIVMGADHAGFELKQAVKQQLVDGRRAVSAHDVAEAGIARRWELRAGESSGFERGKHRRPWPKRTLAVGRVLAMTCGPRRGAGR